VTHRDIKGGNVLVGENGVATLIDFGVARHASVADTLPPDRYGTPGYQAPEVLLSDMSDSLKDDARYAAVDVFALGCTIFFLCVGRELYGPSPSGDGGLGASGVGVGGGGEAEVQLGARTKTKARATGAQVAVDLAVEEVYDDTWESVDEGDDFDDEFDGDGDGGGGGDLISETMIKKRAPRRRDDGGGGETNEEDAMSFGRRPGRGLRLNPALWRVLQRNVREAEAVAAAKEEAFDMLVLRCAFSFLSFSFLSFRRFPGERAND
jgi:serine/threonine protein kinase